jgi:hypothetical protein
MVEDRADDGPYGHGSGPDRVHHVAAWVVASMANVQAWADDAPGAHPPAVPVFLAAAIFPATAVGLLVALRRPGDRVAWILPLGSLSVAVVMAGDGLARPWMGQDPRPPGPRGRRWSPSCGRCCSPGRSHSR